jgi:hypothetical protein
MENRFASTSESSNKPLLFGRKNYLIILSGLVCVIVGFFLMAGGGSTDPEVWKAEEIYSFRRITLAPFVVLLGLGIVIYAIFAKDGQPQEGSAE